MYYNISHSFIRNEIQMQKKKQITKLKGD